MYTASELVHTHEVPVLLVDDDRELNQMLTEYLSAEGFKIYAALDGTTALGRLADETFDLVILDIMLPQLSGFDILCRLRRTLSTPVIVLSARGEDVDRIHGLELGADDYLPKPFNPKELVARMRAVLRRAATTPNAPNDALVFGPLRLSAATLDASLDGRPIRLTGTEFRVLELLMRGAGQVQSREFLTERVLGRRLSTEDRSIDTHISNLRRKLFSQDHDRSGNVEIKNIRSAGYLLVQRDNGLQ